MHPRPTFLLCALALAGCGGEPGTSSGGMTDPTGSTGSTGSSGLASSSGDDPTTGLITGTTTGSSTGTSGGLSTGTGTTEQGSSTSSTGTTGEPAGWALLDVNPASASYDQEVAPEDYLGRVAGFYFAHAT